VNSEALRGFFRLGMFIVVLAVVLLFILKPGSAEYVVTVLSLVIGAMLLALVGWVVRRQ
jgi:hypothetical protein